MSDQQRRDQQRRRHSGADWAITIFAVGAVVLPAILSLLFAFGAFRIGGPSEPEMQDLADITSDTNAVLRASVGAIGGFMLGAGVSLWRLRRSSEQVNDSLVALKSHQELLQGLIRPNIDGSLRRRDDLSPWSEALQGTKNLQMNGMSLSSFSKEYTQRISEMLRSGGTCQFLLVAPGTTSSDVIARTFFNNRSQEDYDRSIQSSLDRLEVLGRENAGTNGSALEIRTIDAIPTTSITLMDRETPSRARAIVELYTPFASSADRPHLELSPSESPIWYEYYAREFQKVWDAAAVYRMFD